MENYPENYPEFERELTSALGLTRKPIAVSFHDHAPAGIARFEGTVPSGCSFWRLAAERPFCTVPGDHYNCPIGSYTHNIDLPESRQSELTGTLGMMAEIGYLRMEEVPGIPRLAKTPGAVVYAPLGQTPVPPDAVIVVGRPAAMMLLVESAVRAGMPSSMPLLARPTCMAIPAVLANGGVITSVGCIGNRVYTDIGEDELYTVIRGADIGKVAAEVWTIAAANAKLRKYHEIRRSQLETV